MIILSYREGTKPEKLDAQTKANMEVCANFLVSMIEKYGKEVLKEISENEQKSPVT